MSDPSPRNSTVITERNYHHSYQTIHSLSFLVGKKKQSAISTEIPCTASEIPLWLNQTIYCMIIDSSIDSSPIDPNHPTSSDPQPIDRQHKTALTIDIQARELESGSPHHHRSNPSPRHHYPLVAMQNSTTTSSPTAVETISATSGSNNSSANTTGNNNNNNNSNHHANSNSNKHNDAATPFTSTALLDSSMPTYWSTAGDDNATTGPTASAAVVNPTITSNQHSRHNSNSSNHGSGSSSSNSNPNHHHHHHHNSNNNNTNHAFPYTATPPSSSSSSSLNNPAHLTQFSPLVVSQHQQQHNHRRVPPGQRRKPFPPSVVNAVGSMQNKNITTNPISGNWNHAGNASPTWKLQNWQQQQQRNSNGGHPPPGAPPPLLNTANSNHRTRPANMPSLARSHRNRSPFSVGRAPIANYDSKSDEAAASTYVSNPSSGKAFSVAELNSALNTVRENNQ
ncbi:uncharacterized protein TRIADDRAFT_58534 [Trichoplax adhaerens]|uniref:Uncharacterized protein n=1 Tax=Trichoplax adhaerens TaxID=10228 RepID=B3S2Y9_TRIAD|nr:predicted protein [Trichoplax adhaerens]EDV22873.1 predicted protein [Trichoplax adhaerens]|eukprot:XP_002114739.1 predicted protein [Trichoplax adhaerens]